VSRGASAEGTVPEGITELLHELAREQGFQRSGVCSARASDHGDALRRWIEEGHHGEMGYMARPDALRRREQPALSLPGRGKEDGVILVVAHDYFQTDPEGVPDDLSRGVIARYARGRDYHRVVGKKLQRVHRRLEEELGEEVPGRVFVDTGPLLERELGRRAGLGWFGRNTMLIHPRHGSYFFLGALLLEIAARPDPPFEADHCGTCRACLDACPTGALLGRDADGAPVMDARLCISYLTIENRGPIPRELRPLIGNRVYGCDICQEVCPFNVKFAEEASEPGYAARGPGERPVGVEALPGQLGVQPHTAEGDGNPVGGGGLPNGSRPAGPGSESGTTGGALAKEGISAETPHYGGRVHAGSRHSHPGTDAPSLTDLLAIALSEETWEAFSRGSAIRRAGRAGFARNVSVAMGNWLSGEEEPPPEAVALLVEALSDPEALVRGHAVWALGRVDSAEARKALERAAASEDDPFVLEELEAVTFH
jgi:epoxyqueuosine reductase